MDITEFGIKALNYYSKKENRYIGEMLYPKKVANIDETVQFVKDLVAEIKKIPILETEYGIDINPEPESFGILSLTTYDISANRLRKTLSKNRCKFIHKWTPLVMYVLKKIHNLNYEDFWVKGNPNARLLLGRDLKDLIVPVKESELNKLGLPYTHIITRLGYRRNLGSTYTEFEGVIDLKFDNVLRHYSTVLIVHRDKYTSNYTQFEDCLSKEYMLDLINHFIIKSKVPEGKGEF